MTSFRHLTKEEIKQLKTQQCKAGNWNIIYVADPFRAERLFDVTFSGEIKLHPFDKTITTAGNRKVISGLYHVSLHQCEIGPDTYISGIKGEISNYKIGREVFIEDVESLVVEGENTFGNGTEVDVMDETGGRSVKIFDRLSAPLAYILAMYRHRPKLTHALNRMIEQYANKVRDVSGKIGDYAIIIHTGTIKNIHIGTHSKIEGTRYLFDGSINSSTTDPVYIGPGVIMRHFIVSEGSSITDDVILDHCFIGHACDIGKQFSAEHSLFFSNCVCHHGEACSVFAGPYTVTHHKSTLLIAGMFSFFNAGSGSNQSNHMYKLGPVHHGVMERGSKTASDTYILWPAKVGAFTVVMGRHYKNPDTSDLPYSYLIESKDESFLAPGVNLRSVGTIRDARKWPERDRRKNPDYADLINFNLLSPYTINKVIAGRDLLKSLVQYSGEKSEFYTYENVKITRSSLLKGIQLYNIALYKFLGNSLIQQITSGNVSNLEELRKTLSPESTTGEGKWTDLAGLIVPLSEVEKMADRIEHGKIRSIKKIREAFQSLHDHYYTWTWNWAAAVLEKETGKKVSTWTAPDIRSLVKKWQESVIELDKMLYDDAKKEFTIISQTGFGIDGDQKIKSLDFEQVRGKFTKNPQVATIREHLKKKTELGNRVLKLLSKIK